MQNIKQMANDGQVQVSANPPAIVIILLVLLAIDLAFFAKNGLSQNIQVAAGAQLKQEKSDKPAKVTNNTRSTAVAYGGRLLGDARFARLLIELDSKVDIQPFYINSPPRLVLDMSKTAFRFQEPENLKPRGLVGELRYGTMARGQSRIVLSLVSPVKIVDQQMTKVKLGRYRYSLDLEKIDAAEFAALIGAQGNEIGKKSKVAIKGDRLLRSAKQAGRMTIVLDPGHGGIDGGAKGTNGAAEKDITLEIALRLEAALKAAGPFDVFLTRREDYFISLRERVRISARKQADLFISIHADTLAQKKVRGTTVYTISKKASDEFAKQLAESENRTDLVAGMGAEEISDDIVDILADLAARETKKFSVRFAKNIVDVFRSNLKLIKNPHRYAAFEVLKGPNVPSVLLELGYLSNKQDEKLLQSEQWREKLAFHLSKAVNLYFASIVR